MITEDYVSFETAKLLKERGFDEECISVYHDGKLQLVSSLGIFCGEGYGEQILTYTNSECKWSPIMISAPTLQMAMKWLREVHDIYIMIDKDFATENGWHYVVVRKRYWADNIDKGLTKQESNSYTYKFACEASIKYCLENLI